MGRGDGVWGQSIGPDSHQMLADNKISDKEQRRDEGNGQGRIRDKDWEFSA